MQLLPKKETADFSSPANKVGFMFAKLRSLFADFLALVLILAVFSAGLGIVQLKAAGIKPSDWLKAQYGQHVSKSLINAGGNQADDVLAILPPIEARKSTGTMASSGETAAAQPSAQIKSKIATQPPKQATSASDITGETTKNSDGTQTTVVSEGNVDQSELARVAALSNAAGTPYGVKFTDQTGSYDWLESVLKDYLNNTLLWKGEIGDLHEIVVADAGTTGWSGLYNGSYTMAQSGDITHAFGWITLNISYYKTLSREEVTAYMEEVLAHEYGHHYTLYHKWVDGDLAAGTRFPDSYYTTRPLSKTETTVDCSSGWSTCEPEIIAEDYAYLYSGFGYDAMAAQFGYPSSALKNWFSNISTIMQGGAVPSEPPAAQEPVPAPAPEPAPVVPAASGTSSTTGADAATPDTTLPTVSIIEPEANPYEWANGNLTIRATGSDNIEVTKMEIYINDTLSGSVDGNGLRARWSIENGPIGQYTITIKAYDAAGNIGSASCTVDKLR